MKNPHFDAVALGFEPRELEGPLAQFQAVRANESGTKCLLSAINDTSEKPLVPEDVLSETFQVWWPKLDSHLKSLEAAPPLEVPTPSRSVEEMLGEVLDLLRAERLASEIEPLASVVSSGSKSGADIGIRVRELRERLNWPQRTLRATASLFPEFLGVFYSY